MKIKILKDCQIPTEHQLHHGEGCDCSVKEPQWFFAGDIIEDYQLHKMDISGLTYRVDMDIIEFP